ncbi:MAG: MarR family transcriptional regulator [Bacteroidota bacterium]|nr:MarR family transcriptional regulator [Bacteroidota bacterium]MDP3145339.1 MarR family transcriptional regulator [Bacteroidota bacterium]
MNLEEEIKQSKFRSEFQKTIINIYYTNCYIFSKFQDILSEYKLTVQQYNILRILRGQFPDTASIGKIKERMLDKNSDITRIIDRLIIKQLAERKNSITDRRVTEIKITKKGLSLLKKMDLVDLKSDNILSHLNETDLKKLNELLDKVRI